MLPWQRLQGQLTNNTPLMFDSYWGVEEVLLYFLDCLVDDVLTLTHGVFYTLSEFFVLGF